MALRLNPRLEMIACPARRRAHIVTDDDGRKADRAQGGAVDPRDCPSQREGTVDVQAPVPGIAVSKRIVLQSEPLEGRALLSRAHVIDLPPTTAVTQTLSIESPTSFVSQQAGDLNVTVVLATDSTTTSYPPESSLGRAITNASKTSVPILAASPVAVTLTAKAAPYSGPAVSATAAASTSKFTPFSTSLTFVPGVTTQNVSIPIPAESASAGPVQIELNATTATTGIAADSVPVFVVDSPEQLPPSIASVHLVGISGMHAAGITITFSKPMDPATVQDVHNYSISSLGMSAGVNLPFVIAAPLNWFSDYSGPSPLIEHTPIKAAVYNPATDTVTLIPRHPLESATKYSVTSPTKLAGHVLTDQDGNPLFDGDPYNGTFSSSVSRNPSETQAPGASISY